jgi:uncharacterized protein (TIGR02687 family)
MNKIEESLQRLFAKHRIVFWYDTNKELRQDYDALELPGVIKIELNNNEFGVKYRILRQQREQKFLLYHEGPEPEDLLDNWLLDVQLAHGEFRTDHASLVLADLGLGPEFAELAEQHLDFFGASGRREQLKKLITKRDTHQQIRLKMLAVCAGAEPRLDVILEQLLAELAVDREDRFKVVQRANLEHFFWAQLARHYGYESDTKTLRDFVISLFKSCYASEVGGGKALLGTEAVIFLKRWKDSVKHKATFEALSSQCEEILDISKDLQVRDYSVLQHVDFFRAIDRRIISDLVKAVAARTMSAGVCATYIRSRRQSHWYAEFEHLYEAIEYASSFLHEIDTVALQAGAFDVAITCYCRSWFKVDQLYRKFIYHRNESSMTSLLQSLTDKVENLYNNGFLLPLGDAWQQLVDKLDYWRSPSIVRQDRFYAKWVEPFCSQKKKVYVVISDAFRYEIGEELQRLVQTEDRYEAQLDPMLSMVPSYTQLGMAALLPHKEMGFIENSGGSVAVTLDAAATQGTANRGKILEAAVSDGAAALRAEEFFGLNRDDCRALIRDNSVVYIYHNRIDATGDKTASEGRVFAAVEEALNELVKIIKKLAANNATNMIVTSDHGFIYQDRPLEDSDYLTAEPKGEHLFHRDRRFVIGKNLERQDSFKHFTASQLALGGDFDVQIPKSINRMRLKGSGSRFVHGGASLQEVVIPVLRINKKRQSDVKKVSVDIISSGSNTITTGQVSVAFYQCEPVGGKVLARTLRAALYSADNELVSDSHEIQFDLTAEEPRNREIRINFLFNRKADALNGQTVILRLDEKLSGTSHYQEYKTVKYRMQKSFETDFDFS